MTNDAHAFGTGLKSALANIFVFLHLLPSLHIMFKSSSHCSSSNIWLELHSRIPSIHKEFQSHGFVSFFMYYTIQLSPTSCSDHTIKFRVSPQIHQIKNSLLYHFVRLNCIEPCPCDITYKSEILLWWGSTTVWGLGGWRFGAFLVVLAFFTACLVIRIGGMVLSKLCEKMVKFVENGFR